MRDLVESGEYFRQSRAWYNERFLLPFSYWFIEFSFLLLVATLLIALLGVAYSLYPTNLQVMYVVKVEDEQDVSANISHPSDVENDEQNVEEIAKIFARTFVEAIEGYKYSTLEDNMLFVVNNSTRSIFNRYRDSLNIDNPDSPVLKYRNMARRVIYVKSVTLLSTNSANVTFNAKVLQNAQTLEDSDWIARLEFTMSPINLQSEDGDPFNFYVTDYKSSQIGSQHE